ncbi:hypothetical protein EVAR_47454_1 [Eumeta japonica]|uniref:Uncharacterized protein n=1 Tax=Eumeta variegata TaxID=151549 RepID=A0A4C1XAB1_EUMVA|nr:hypothetical protein EVAR_47454_1 [Eumeta japonica]
MFSSSRLRPGARRRRRRIPMGGRRSPPAPPPPLDRVFLYFLCSDLLKECGPFTGSKGATSAPRDATTTAET